METRAPFVIVGAFVLAAIVAVFGFVYWLQNTGGLGPRTSYHVQFEGSVSGSAGRRGGAVQRHPGRRSDRSRARARQPARRQCDHLGRFDDAGARRHQGRPGVSGPDRRSRDRARRRHAGRAERRGADAGRRARRRAGDDAGRARCAAQGRFGAVGEFGRVEGHDRQFQGVFGRPGAQHRQARRHRRRPRTHDRRHQPAAEDHL